MQNELEYQEACYAAAEQRTHAAHEGDCSPEKCGWSTMSEAEVTRLINEEDARSLEEL